jgi:hypothetical protein
MKRVGITATRSPPPGPVRSGGVAHTLFCAGARSEVPKAVLQNTVSWEAYGWVRIPSVRPKSIRKVNGSRGVPLPKSLFGAAAIAIFQQAAGSSWLPVPCTP